MAVSFTDVDDYAEALYARIKDDESAKTRLRGYVEAIDKDARLKPQFEALVTPGVPSTRSQGDHIAILKALGFSFPDHHSSDHWSPVFPFNGVDFGRPVVNSPSFVVRNMDKNDYGGDTKRPRDNGHVCKFVFTVYKKVINMIVEAETEDAPPAAPAPPAPTKPTKGQKRNAQRKKAKAKAKRAEESARRAEEDARAAAAAAAGAGAGAGGHAVPPQQPARPYIHRLTLEQEEQLRAAAAQRRRDKELEKDVKKLFDEYVIEHFKQVKNHCQLISNMKVFNLKVMDCLKRIKEDYKDCLEYMINIEAIFKGQLPAKWLPTPSAELRAQLELIENDLKELKKNPKTMLKLDRALGYMRDLITLGSSGSVGGKELKPEESAKEFANLQKKTEIAINIMLEGGPRYSIDFCSSSMDYQDLQSQHLENWKMIRLWSEVSDNMCELLAFSLHLINLCMRIHYEDKPHLLVTPPTSP